MAEGYVSDVSNKLTTSIFMVKYNRDRMHVGYIFRRFPEPVGGGERVSDPSGERTCFYTQADPQI
jgi:hypothetical protein